MGKIAVTGNNAVSLAMKQINPHVVAAYPISPQSEVVEQFSEFVADGEVQTEFVPVESEHSAMSACIGASAAGARVMTATSSQGLALMWEMLYIAAGDRLPIVMPTVNRALSSPVCIHCDHSDTMGARDAGWIQLYCKDAQEAYDTLIQAVKIAEDPRVLLPVMVCYDGYIVSHGMTSIESIEDQAAKDFVGQYKPKYPLLDLKNPVTYGALALFDYYYEIKRSQLEAMTPAKDVIAAVGKAYGAISGREYGLFETYKLDDAEVGIVVLSSAASTGEVVVDDLRAKGVKAGILRIRSYRPFPAEEIVAALKGLKALCVMDRASAPGAPAGPVGSDVRSTLLGSGVNLPVLNVMYGLGGRDVSLENIEDIFQRLQQIAVTGVVEKPMIYVGVRGESGNGN
jgi:pyruvate ferredoxin oxidoreductase alpha subunit